MLLGDILKGTVRSYCGFVPVTAN